jgi:methionyl-tRNA formyltransferase
MKLPRDRRFCLIGGGIMFKAFLPHFAARNGGRCRALVLSNSEVDAAWSPAGEIGIDRLCAELGLDFRDVAAKGCKHLIEIVREEELNVCIVMSWRAIFTRAFIECFEGRIFNLHNSALPQFRGAGGFTWQIMQGRRRVGATVHQVVSCVDAGKMLLQAERDVAAGSRRPEDYMREFMALCEAEIFPSLATTILEADTLDLTAQDAQAASYFPMFYTPENGLIDFSWSPKDVVQFVDSVGSPYAGGRFDYGDRRFFAGRCDLVADDAGAHPFMKGLIIDVTAMGITVIAAKGSVRLHAIRTESGDMVKPANFRIGDRVYNNPDDLHNALRYRHSI